jgi:long-chain fatty acid transport protein
VLALALLTALTGMAEASGYYFTDAGTRGMSRGGAFIASANDLSAQYYNPAALINLKRSQFYVNHSLVSQKIAFTRQDYVENDDGYVGSEKAPAYDYDGQELADGYPTANNIAAAMNIPQFAVGSSLGVKNAYFAFGLHPPFAPRVVYEQGVRDGVEPTGPQRYNLVDSLVIQFYAGPSAAYRVLPWLTLGASANMTYVSATYGINLMICQDDLTDDLTARCPADASGVENDIGVGLDMADPFRFTWNAGLLAEPTDWMKIGFSVLPPLKVAGKGDIQAQFANQHWMGPNGFDVLGAERVNDKDVTVMLTMPWVLRGGVAFEPGDKSVVELAGVWQRWSMTKEIRVTDVNLNIPLTEFVGTDLEDVAITDDVVIPADYDNAWSVRLGGEHEVVEALSLRGGLFYETSAIPIQTQAVSLVDGPKVGYGVGATYWYKKQQRRVFSLDAGFSQTFIAERTITGSQIRRQEIPINLQEVLAGEVTATITPGLGVGNGTMSSQMMFFSAGATVYWGKSAANQDGKPAPKQGGGKKKG